jgi:hypothetical protein
MASLIADAMEAERQIRGGYRDLESERTERTFAMLQALEPNIVALYESFMVKILAATERVHSGDILRPVK